MVSGATSTLSLALALPLARSLAPGLSLAPCLRPGGYALLEGLAWSCPHPLAIATQSDLDGNKELSLEELLLALSVVDPGQLKESLLVCLCLCSQPLAKPSCALPGIVPILRQWLQRGACFAEFAHPTPACAVHDIRIIGVQASQNNATLRRIESCVQLCLLLRHTGLLFLANLRKENARNRGCGR